MKTLSEPVARVNRRPLWLGLLMLIVTIGSAVEPTAPASIDWPLPMDDRILNLEHESQISRYHFLKDGSVKVTTGVKGRAVAPLLQWWIEGKSLKTGYPKGTAFNELTLVKIDGDLWHVRGSNGIVIVYKASTYEAVRR